MSDKKTPELSDSRRDFLKASGMSALALGVGAGLGGTSRALAGEPAAQSAGSGFVPGLNPGKGPYNILFILVDQERWFRPGELPVGLMVWHGPHRDDAVLNVGLLAERQLTTDRQR